MKRRPCQLRAVDFVLDALKLLRSGWMTQYEICDHYGVGVASVCRYLRTMVEYGYLLCERMPRASDGKKVLHYTVAPAWKGVA